MNKVLLFFWTLCVLLLFDGCVIVRDIETVPVEDSKEENADGPGEGQYIIIQNTKGIRTIDTGKRMAYGFLPGLGNILFNDYYEEFSFDRVFNSYDRSFANRGPRWLIGSVVENVIFAGIPTLASTGAMAFAPPYSLSGVMREWSAVSVLGRHDWTTKNEESYEWGEPVRYIERRVFGGKTPPSVCGRTGNGYPLYFDFPGMDTIETITETNGQVAVMFAKGPRMMRVFSKRKLKDFFGDRIVFEDLKDEDDEIAARQVVHQRAIRKVRRKVGVLVKRTEHKYATEGTKKQLSEMLVRINSEIKRPLPSKDGIVEELGSEGLKIESLLKADYAAAMKRERAAEVKRIDDTIARVEELNGKGEYKDAIAVCDKEIAQYDMRKHKAPSDLTRWKEVRNDSIVQWGSYVDKEIDRFISEKNWQEARALADELQSLEEMEKKYKDCLVRIESARLVDVVSEVQQKIKREEWWQACKEVDDELEKDLSKEGDLSLTATQVYELEKCRLIAEKAIRDAREKRKKEILVLVSRREFDSATTQSKEELAQSPADDNETRSFWASFIHEIAAEEETYRKQKTAEEASARAREKEKRLMGNVVYTSLKKIYNETLEQHNWSETGFIAKGDENPYILRIYNWNSYDEITIAYHRKSGYIRWPSYYMDVESARMLINARIKMHEIENDQ